MSYDPSSKIQDYQVFGEFGDVNPSITDSSTYTFLNPATMKEIFTHEIEGCFLYSRHWNPINKYLSRALAALEDTEMAQVTASGMAAISATILQLCQQGDEIVSSHTIYGGTYALFKNFLPRLGIKVNFVHTASKDEVEAAINERTRVIYCESISNPLLEVADIPTLAEIAHRHSIKLVVDNTFSPMILSPARLGADIVIHSLTKFINGTSDCVAGCICASEEFIHRLTDVNSGACMLLGPVLDSLRSASILKNLHSLHIRMQKHSANALYLARRFSELGIKTHYPGLETHKDYALITRLMNEGFGYGGMLVIDVGDEATADRLMQKMQEEKVGYLAVSLGYFKTLFSPPGNSTSSEIPKEEQREMGISSGMIRLSVGLDNDIERTYRRIYHCLETLGIIK
ncbi:MAG: aminotransferase class I/II-fold pyridoxal phosphate-dependent enzyme [Acidobacteriota bacterium]|nr:aminotransferase class I/II-fold pyridoxal phosphate-dependent enzyme [Blastocatellia bacterium]MDW8413357.1 aminotransferase class I/II-fold pyridoxal phosphate-dependent enzyme [Acidobacteriota bacterium]